MQYAEYLRDHKHVFAIGGGKVAWQNTWALASFDFHERNVILLLSLK